MARRTRNIHNGERHRPAHGLRNVRLVIRAIQIDTVPALRKDDIRANPAGTRLLGEMVGIPDGIHARRIRAPAPVGLRVTAVALLHVAAKILGSAAVGVARQHAKAWAEGRGAVGRGGGIVQGYAAYVAGVELVRDLGDALVSVVASFEVEIRSPVVAEILKEVTGGAVCELGDVG